MRFIFLLIILSSLNLKANDSMDRSVMNDTFIEANAYETGRQLCYTYTYHREDGSNPTGSSGSREWGRRGTGYREDYRKKYSGERENRREDINPMAGNFDRLMYNSFIDDEKYQAGLIKWHAIKDATFQSALWTLDQSVDENSQHEKFWYARSNYLKALIETKGFYDAIVHCANARNVDAFQLYESIKGDISANDIGATLAGRFFQVAIGEKALGVAFKGVKYLWRGMKWLARWSRDTRANRWLMNTRAVRALKTRMKFLWNQDRVVRGRDRLANVRWKNAGAGVGAGAAMVGLAAIKFNVVDSPYLQILEEKRVARRQGEELSKNGLEIDNNQEFWIGRYSTYQNLIQSLNIATTDATYNMSRESYTDHLYRCDPAIAELRRFCVYINIYVVDYYIVQRALEHFRQDWFTEELSEEIFTLEVIEQMFNLRRLVLEREAALGDRQAKLTLKLIEESKNDPSLRCDFSDKTSLTLCRLHYLYIIQDVNGRLTPQQATQLEELENMYLSP